MTPAESEVGRMSIWDKVLTAALNTGKDIDAAIASAEKAVKAFEDRFHAEAEKVIHGTDVSGP